MEHSSGSPYLLTETGWNNTLPLLRNSSGSPLSPGGERGGIIGFPSWGNSSGSPLSPGGGRGGIIGSPSWGNSSGSPLSPDGEQGGIIPPGGIVMAPLSPGRERGGILGGIGAPPYLLAESGVPPCSPPREKGESAIPSHSPPGDIYSKKGGGDTPPHPLCPRHP